MSRIIRVHEDVVDGKDGFIVNWEFAGLTETSARFRAVMQTALRFPTTITDAEVVDVERQVTAPGNPNYRVAVFVPTEGFLSAGIGNPVQWIRERFEEVFGER